VDQGGDRRGTGHGIGKPHGQGELGGFPTAAQSRSSPSAVAREGPIGALRFKARGKVPVEGKKEGDGDPKATSPIRVRMKAFRRR